MAVESKPVDAGVDYIWAAVERTAMGGYITGVETAFIERRLRLARGPLRLTIDAGAGDGRFAALLAKHAERVIATEMRDHLIPSIEARGANVSAVLVGEGDMRLPVEDGDADFIISIEAADLAQDVRFYQDCFRALRPGGQVVVTLQNRTSWKGLLASLRRSNYKAEGEAVYYSWSYADLTSAMRQAGLEVEDATGLNWLPFTRMKDSSLVRPLAAAERVLGLRNLPRISPWALVAARKPA